MKDLVFSAQKLHRHEARAKFWLRHGAEMGSDPNSRKWGLTPFQKVSGFRDSAVHSGAMPI
jgi:hypothetical protein